VGKRKPRKGDCHLRVVSEGKDKKVSFKRLKGLHLSSSSFVSV
jgi:hypothetical protein